MESAWQPRHMACTHCGKSGSVAADHSITTGATAPAFRDDLRLVLRQEGKHKLSILVSPRCVDTYLVDAVCLDQLSQNWTSTTGHAWTSEDTDWFVQLKHRGREDEYVRISAWPPGGAGRDYRVTRRSMEQVERSWQGRHEQR